MERGRDTNIYTERDLERGREGRERLREGERREREADDCIIFR
jgi:hypothetical protein